MKPPAFLLKLLQRFGIDRAVASTLLSRVWVVVSGIVSLVMLTHFLSPNEQGFYYTFISILGLQILVELGISLVILQFASHEKAKLEWTNQGTLEGDAEAKARLASLVRFGFKWYGIAAILVVITVLPIGLWFFATHRPTGGAIHWKLPWVWFVLVTAGTLFISPLFAILQGCGLVAEIAIVRFHQMVIGSVLFWIVLLMGGKLLSAPVTNTVALFWSLGWLLLKKRAVFKDLLAVDLTLGSVAWREEIWPLQWRIAVSWLSGYFIFQMFNPVLFAFSGAAEAGRMGLSMAAVNALSAFAVTWMETKVAPFGGLVVLRKFQELDQLFFASFRRSAIVMITGCALFWSLTFALHEINYPLSNRLLAPLPMALLLIAALFNLVIEAESLYLRCFKREPLMGVTILVGLLVALSTYYLGRSFGVNGMMSGYLLITAVVGGGGGTWIFQQKRRLWQIEDTT